MKQRRILGAAAATAPAGGPPTIWWPLVPGRRGAQHRPAKTTFAPYSLRGKGRPAVTAPRRWDEVTVGDLLHGW